MVNGISSELLLSFVNFHGKTKLSPKEMFKHLSLEMGGDGTKITKDQLDNYIKKAKSGAIKISAKKLRALEQLQNNWDTISGKKDSITEGDLEKYIGILLDATAGGPESSEDSDTDNSELIKLALNFYNTEGSSNLNAKSLLKSLLAGSTDENDDKNANLIDALTNSIAKSDANSTVEKEV